jgi:hypothetical protein
MLSAFSEFFWEHAACVDGVFAPPNRRYNFSRDSGSGWTEARGFEPESKPGDRKCGPINLLRYRR